MTMMDELVRAMERDLGEVCLMLLNEGSRCRIYKLRRLGRQGDTSTGRAL